MPVLASYAAGVALNNFLPANIGTLVMMLMFVAIIEAANFPGILAGYVVQGPLHPAHRDRDAVEFRAQAQALLQGLRAFEQGARHKEDAVGLFHHALASL